MDGVFSRPASLLLGDESLEQPDLAAEQDGKAKKQERKGEARLETLENVSLTGFI